MPGRDTESPVFLGDLLDQNFLQRAYWLQVPLQVAQQAFELFLALAHKYRKALGK